MALNFVNYAAFAAAGKQVDRDMREFRQSFGTESRKGAQGQKPPLYAVKKVAAGKRTAKR
ncbi:hypothetical protein [Burkholderia multivorans]|uniref:hypothetical protein n=1 Tax=Burkholderia multivorans TaxID=87883 RepID=UPI0028709F1D|nr:hypothetical protein [Burkholderia multivorans]